MISLRRTHLAGWHNYFREYFSTDFKKGNTCDMIQLFELSCAISDSAMPGCQQMLQTGTCPLSCLPSLHLFWIYFRSGSGHGI